MVPVCVPLFSNDFGFFKVNSFLDYACIYAIEKDMYLVCIKESEVHIVEIIVNIITV